MKKLILLSAFALSLTGLAIPTQAANFSFTGSLNGPDDVQLFTFVVGSTSTVTLRTWSYAGGVNAAGNSISRGGFDPILALFNGTTSSAAKIAENDDGDSAHVDADIVTGSYFDTWLQAVLNPGTYTVSVSQFAAFSSGATLGDGFSPSGFSSFVDVTGNGRSNEWAFDILDVENAAVVPPTHGVPDGGSSLLLLSIATGACGILSRKKRNAPAV